MSTPASPKVMSRRRVRLLTRDPICRTPKESPLPRDRNRQTDEYGERQTSKHHRDSPQKQQRLPPSSVERWLGMLQDLSQTACPRTAGTSETDEKQDGPKERVHLARKCVAPIVPIILCNIIVAHFHGRIRCFLQNTLARSRKSNRSAD